MNEQSDNVIDFVARKAQKKTQANLEELTIANEIKLDANEAFSYFIESMNDAGYGEDLLPIDNQIKLAYVLELIHSIFMCSNGVEHPYNAHMDTVVRVLREHGIQIKE